MTFCHKKYSKAINTIKKAIQDHDRSHKAMLSRTWPHKEQFSFANIFCSFCNIFCYIWNRFCSRKFIFPLRILFAHVSALTRTTTKHISWPLSFARDQKVLIFLKTVKEPNFAKCSSNHWQRKTRHKKPLIGKWERLSAIRKCSFSHFFNGDILSEILLKWTL